MSVMVKIVNGSTTHYLRDYKSVGPFKFILDLVEDISRAGEFDEDDWVVALCQQNWFADVEIMDFMD